ncbi:zinc-dependent alcohol dehydrogenase [[Eubacterium] cellulosolvens]
MMAVKFYGPSDIRIEKAEIPPLQPDEVRMKIKAAGICGSDLHFIFGEEKAEDYGFAQKGIFGHEFSGTIIKLGKNVERFEVGDNVAVHPQIFCGHCSDCKNGRFTFCKDWLCYGFQYAGGFAEYANVKATQLLLKPDILSFEEVALLDPLACGLHCIHRADIASINNIAIIGCGSMGLSILAFAKALGVKNIYAMDLLAYRLEIAKQLGANEVIDISQEESVNQINQLADKDIQVVFEAVGGDADTINLATKIIRKGGRIVYAGWFTKPKMIDLFHNWKYEIDLIPSYVWGFWEGVDEIRIALDMLAKGQIDIKKMITHRFPLQDFNKAIDKIKKKKDNIIKVIITP